MPIFYTLDLKPPEVKGNKIPTHVSDLSISASCGTKSSLSLRADSSKAILIGLLSYLCHSLSCPHIYQLPVPVALLISF